MMVQCVTHVISSQYLEFVGNVLNVGIMTFVQFATMGINIISVIVFIVLLHLVVKGKVMITWVITLHRVTDILEACPASIFRVTGNILMDTEVSKRKKCIINVDRSAMIVADQNHDLIGSYYVEFDVSSDPFLGPGC